MNRFFAMLALTFAFIAGSAEAKTEKVKNHLQVVGNVTAVDGIFSDDVTVADDLDVTGTCTCGTITFDEADVATDFSVATDKVTMAAATGNTVIAGTGTIRGNLIIGASAGTFDVTAASGAFVCDSTGQVTGNFSVGGAYDSSKAQITGASGNFQTDGTLTVDGASTLTGAVTMSSTATFKRVVVTAADGTTTVTAAQSGAVFANTGTSSTTTFTLPTAAAGLHYCFVEAGDAGGELLIGVQAGDSIYGKTHAANDGTGVATAAGTGVKNTAATNVKGDFMCLVGIAANMYYMTSMGGVWASR